MIRLIKYINRIIRTKGSNIPTNHDQQCKFKTNIFNTQFERSALVSFIVYPYVDHSHGPIHTQALECITICEVLNEFGYNIDLTDYDYDDRSCLERNYDVILGFGAPIELILSNTHHKKF